MDHSIVWFVERIEFVFFLYVTGDVFCYFNS